MRVVPDVVDARFAVRAHAPAAARRALDVLVGQVEDGVIEKVRLLASELVSNSIRHAGLGDDQDVRLRVRVTEEAVRVEVGDHGPGFEPSGGPPALESGSGWGLFLVDRLSDRWGVACGGETCVWFEIDR